ncbi:uncharacterized protein KD926_010279 [Aspergillus affinis]|uniref:uncharacterized protein n=1 Tax=Aspergillus affinis TaxID=1070780 RepID=UPI0022FE74CF|nr:uncharacterized protein KD926_010279 [Aspergillus affinis]KAI9038823.1 hypothetical protein KD926_010279 [Aspergillus affinis]
MSPVAKGVIITVSALVAAGIAVYESPQFRQWVDNSRRKIAVALHHLGDEIQPRNATSSPSQDISMTEELGPEAEERRRLVREDIQNRRSMLEEHRKRRQSARPGSFDALVDDEGRLLGTETSGAYNGSLANSTAVELGTSQVVQRGGKQQTDSLAPLVGEEGPSNASASASAGNDKLHIAIPPPIAQSATLINYTPTSETSGMDHSMSTLDTLDNMNDAGQSRSRSSSSNRTEQSQVLFNHPGLTANETNGDMRSPFADLSDLDPTSFEHRDRPSTPSSTSSFSQIYASAEDASSDGTLSDLGRSTGAATSASWSEVGSVISNDDFNSNHHGL